MATRIQKKDFIDPNNTTRYYYNYKWQALCEYDDDDTIKGIFVYGNYIDEVLSKPPYFYYVHDHLYSPVAMVFANGTVIERYEYDAYGKPTIFNADFTTERANSNYGNPYLFTGRRVDILDSGSLKIQYNRNRYYDYYTGRWLTHDPLGITPNCRKPNEFRPFGQYEDALNLYEMLDSNPVLQTDPWGLLGPIGTCRALYRIWSRIAEFRRTARDLGWPPSGSNPYRHCVSSCNMTRAHGRDYAEWVGLKKELLDLEFYVWAEVSISDCVWEKLLGDWGRKKVSDWVCSAFQLSDFNDNAAGRDCGDKPGEKGKSCEQCCTDKGIGKKTEEGPDTDRPYGPLCTGRYEDAMKPEEEVEKP